MKVTIGGSKVVQGRGLQVALPMRGVAREVEAQTARTERNPSRDDTRGATERLQHLKVGFGTKLQFQGGNKPRSLDTGAMHSEATSPS